MSLLRILRNLAVLVILTAAFASIARPITEQSTCTPLGGRCSQRGQVTKQCCTEFCGIYGNCCGLPSLGGHRACTKNSDCCSNLCLGGRCE
jgi:hypothetical protein